jgi:hypothetical protein
MAKTRRAYNYQPPSYEEAQKIVEQASRQFDNFIKQEIPKPFKARVGDNVIRILPPTWENARHFAYEVKLHRNIGMNSRGFGSTYLCPKCNDLSPYSECPVCEEVELLNRRGSNKDLINKIRLSTSNICYIIDREDEKAGVQPWIISQTRNAEIVAQATNKKNHRYINIVHPIEGRDLEFKRIGSGLDTEYKGFKIEWEPSPLSENADLMDKWLDYIEEHPIPDILQFYSPEHIAEKFHGKSDIDEEPEPEPTRSKRLVTETPEEQAPWEDTEEPTETQATAPEGMRRRQSLPEDEPALESPVRDPDGSSLAAALILELESAKEPEKDESASPNISALKARLQSRLSKQIENS